MLHSLKKYQESEIAQQRMKILKFYEQYGEKATKEAFGADRKVLSRWRKKLIENNGNLAALIPYSTRPNNLRKSKIPLSVIEFIRELRENHPRIGKDKIKVFLDRFCQEYALKPISTSSIGDIIRKNNYFFQPSGRIYHNPDSKWAENARRNRKKRLRIRNAPRNAELGHIISDTVEKITDGVKEYFYSAIDVRSKFAVTLNYKGLNSRNMKDFYWRFKKVYPYRIKKWQSDNGPEHLGEFEEQVKRDKLTHLFSYPRCPKINTYIERYNRTIQEEFIDYNMEIIHDKELFNKALAEYIIYYNTQRPHYSLGLKAPVEFLVSELKMSQMSVTYTVS